MGTFTVPLQVGDAASRRFTEIEALVDTGATHTLLPKSLLDDLGVEALETVSFLLADEQEVECSVGQAPVRIDGRERTAVVVFGEENAMPLLGATTLEVFNLGVDTVGRRLIPVPGLLKRSLGSPSSSCGSRLPPRAPVPSHSDSAGGRGASILIARYADGG